MRWSFKNPANEDTGLYILQNVEAKMDLGPFYFKSNESIGHYSIVNGLMPRVFIRKMKKRSWLYTIRQVYPANCSVYKLPE